MNCNKTFLFYLPLNEKCAFQSHVHDESYLWHLCCRHMNYKGLKLLKDKNKVIRLPKIKEKKKFVKDAFITYFQKHPGGLKFNYS